MIDLAKILEQHAEWLRDPRTGERADLRGAILSEADLRWAILSEADLRWAIGFRLLTQTDHGYIVAAQQAASGEWRIRAGCREFSLAAARAHWGADHYHTPSSGRRVLACLDWLEAELAREAEAG